jgi:hypothetical protein
VYWSPVVGWVYVPLGGGPTAPSPPQPDHELPGDQPTVTPH